MTRLKSNLPNLSRFVQNHEDRVTTKVLGIMEESTAEGADKMIEVINTSGTGWVGRGSQAFAEGRVDTGYMRDSVSSEEEKNSRRIVGRVGWGIQGNAAEPYFLDQEEGFINPWTGEFVEPMLALAQGAIAARDTLIKEMKNARF